MCKYRLIDLDIRSLEPIFGPFLGLGKTIKNA